MRRVINILISIIATVLITFFTYKSYQSAKVLEVANKNYYEAQTDIGDIVKRKFSSVLSSLSFGMVKEEKPKVDLDKLKAEMIVAKDNANKEIKYLAISSALLLVLYFVVGLNYFTITTALVSLITLIFGLITPILMIVIHKNVNYLGDIVLSFESKTIVGTISHLYHNGNFPVALAILLFSVVVPLLKTLSMIAVLVFKELHIAQKIVSLFKHLGKWSMLDVFVVSLLLVYLSAGSSENSYSQIENGTYIFMIYVILSIITSIGVNGVLKEQKSLSS